MSVRHFSKWRFLAMAIAVAASVSITNNAAAKKLNIIYIPMDNRPVCLDYVKDTIEAADCKLILPPEKYIASNTQNGNPEKLLSWLEEKAENADAAVISTDALLYGGLVGSRTHSESTAALDARLQRLYELKFNLPIKLYAFSTIMRTPHASKGRVEPAYYEEVGPSIFAYSALMDKADQGKATMVDKLTMQALGQSLRKDNLGDWLERRQKNQQINEGLMRLARSNKFHFLAIGKDDNAVQSATHMDTRHLRSKSFDVSPETLQIVDGVDQLGLLLMARAYNEANNQKPRIYPLYAPGIGAETLPQYSDARFQDSVPLQIIAAGGEKVDNAANADLILAINTPQDGIVKDSTYSDNKFFANQANLQFMRQLQNQIANGKKISLADVSYSNGADNGFMNAIAKNNVLDGLVAYNGWNTGDNAVGYAIAQGIFAEQMEPYERKMLIRQRLFDDWFYQSNARNNVSKELEARNREDLKYDLAKIQKPVLSEVTTDMKTLANTYAFTKGSEFKITFPWQRLFEIGVEVKANKKEK